MLPADQRFDAHQTPVAHVQLGQVVEEQDVADLMPEGVVDLLEAIEVQQQQRQWLPRRQLRRAALRLGLAAALRLWLAAALRLWLAAALRLWLAVLRQLCAAVRLGAQR